jgi:hypothetical protein
MGQSERDALRGQRARARYMGYALMEDRHDLAEDCDPGDRHGRNHLSRPALQR